MHDGNRRRVDKALIGTVLVAVLGIGLYWSMFYDMGFQSGQNERKANVESEHYASETANQIDRECSAKAGQAARECIAKIVASERESQRNESDLAAQWKAADWAMWAGILAGAQVIATMFGLYYVSYRDAFGRRRLTTGRYFLDAKTKPNEGIYALKVCATGNKAN